MDFKLSASMMAALKSSGAETAQECVQSMTFSLMTSQGSNQ